MITSDDLKKWMLRLRFAGNREWFYMTMGRAAKEGRPVLDIAAAICNYAPNSSPTRKVLQNVMTAVKDQGYRKRQGVATIGTELAGYIPDDERMLIAAGEASSQIYQGYSSAADLCRWKTESRKSIMSVFTKPAIMVLAIFALMYVISTQVVPEFLKLSDVAPPKLRTLDWVSRHYFYLLGGTVAVLIGGGNIYLALSRYWVGPLREKAAFLFALPSQLKCAFFLRSVSSFIASGVSIVDAIKNISSTRDKYLKYQCLTVLSLIRQGEPFEQTLAKTSLVPKQYHWVLAAYGSMSDKERMYSLIAQEINLELNKKIKKMAALADVLVLAVFGGVIGWIWFALMSSAMAVAR